jgi:hypothetical protein
VAKLCLLIGILLGVTSFAFSERISKVEAIVGRIVAYSNGLGCLNGNAQWSMLIHIRDRSASVQAHFVEVRFSLPCNETPEWLTQKPSQKKFRLMRDKDADSILKEFFDCATESPNGHTSEPCPHIPLWKRLPGMEHETLPFGRQVPSYRSVDLPFAPVV